MPRTVCIIQGHPDGTGTHFCHALADAYARGAAAQGVTVERLDIAEIAPEPLHDEGEYESAPAEGSAMAAARAAVMRADHLVIVFPLWLGGMPARLKAFMEQLARDGFLIAERAGGGWPEAKLKGRTARVIVTMGMPAFVYRTWFLNAGVAVLKRLILGFAGVGPVRQTTIGGVGGLSEVARARRLDRVDALGRRLI
jgi:putative NADPH-quinone reductase